MALNAALFVLIFLGVGYNNRLAADDFHYLIKSKQLGVWDAMLFYYHNWNPRWSATLVTNAFLSSYSGPITLFLFHFSSLFFGILSVYSFLRGMILHLSLPFKKTQLFLISTYLLGALFYGAFAKDDTWYWITVAPMYLWGSFAAILGGSLILHRWNEPIRSFLIGLLFLYAGGASETIAITTLTILFFLGFITHRGESSKRIDRKALHIGTIACLVGFGIDILGAGAQVRYEHLPHYTLTDRLVIGFWNYIKFTFKEIPVTLPAILLFASPLAFFGRKQLRFQITSFRDVLWNNRMLLGIADLLIILLSLVMAFVMGEMGPTRSWIPLTVIVTSVTVVITYQMGTWIYIRSNGKLFHLILIFQLILIGFQSYTGFQQIGSAATYAAATDSRMKFIDKELIAGESLIELEALPQSGWLFTSEITNDTAHFRNKHLSLYLGGHAKLILRDTTISISE